MTEQLSAREASRILAMGLLIGFLLNLTGWLGNNFLLRDMWKEIGTAVSSVAWRDSIWRDVLSFVPDFVYGIAICWLYVKLRPNYVNALSASLRAGLFVAIVGGITTYFAIANSGFIPWRLTLASFVLVFVTKLPLAVIAGHLIDSGRQSK
jgi:hypothetical protein